MVSSVKSRIYSLVNKAAFSNNTENGRRVTTAFRSLLHSDFEGDTFVLKIPEKSVNSLFDLQCNKSLLNNEHPDVINKIELKQYSNETYLTFNVEKNNYISEVLNEVPAPDFLSFKNNEKIIVEFSSPNVAKPFHMGHLRSTVIGQFVAKILANSCKVIRVNYLGDWGTQFGLVQAGLKDMALDLNNLSENPLKVINEAYVRANQDSSLKNQAKIISSTLEKNSDSEELDVWMKLRELTINHLKETYKVLNITFDEYTWESQYAKGFSSVLEDMKNFGLIEEVDNQLFVSNGDKKIPLIKSDGTSLYLSRDILAALDRHKRHKCKSIMYVIDKSQEDHVGALQYVVSTLTGSDIVEHVKFGKIIGMSSRKGTSIFLSDILNQATQLMAEQQDKSPNTRNRSFEVIQTLAISTLVVYLLKQRRTKDLTFNWNLALQSKGDTGVKMQYTHSRLSSLEENCGVELPDECHPELISEFDALKLIALLDRFDQVVALSEITLESYHLVNYAFKLCNMSSVCLKKLPVKGADINIAKQRLLLFHKTRVTLNTAMSVLGLKPLTNM